MDDIGDVIRNLRQQWVTLRHLESFTQINGGMCEEFADKIASLIPGAVANWDWEEDEDQEDWVYCHCFVKYKGRYYDAESPDGVDEWRQLPFFVSPWIDRKCRIHHD